MPQEVPFLSKGFIAHFAFKTLCFKYGNMPLQLLLMIKAVTTLTKHTGMAPFLMILQVLLPGKLRAAGGTPFWVCQSCVHLLPLELGFCFPVLGRYKIWCYWLIRQT